MGNDCCWNYGIHDSGDLWTRGPSKEERKYMKTDRYKCWQACVTGEYGTALRLLQSGVSPQDAVSCEGQEALLTVCGGIGNPDIVRLLLDHKASPNARARGPTEYSPARSALTYASTSGKADAVRVLLEAKADVNMHYDDNGTALYHIQELRKIALTPQFEERISAAERLLLRAGAVALPPPGPGQLRGLSSNGAAASPPACFPHVPPRASKPASAFGPGDAKAASEVPGDGKAAAKAASLTAPAAPARVESSSTTAAGTISAAGGGAGELGEGGSVEEDWGELEFD